MPGSIWATRFAKASRLSASSASAIGPTLAALAVSTVSGLPAGRFPLGLYVTAGAGKLDERTISLCFYYALFAARFVAALRCCTVFYHLASRNGLAARPGMSATTIRTMSLRGKAGRLGLAPAAAARLLHLRQPGLRQPLHQSQHGGSDPAGLHPHRPAKGCWPIARLVHHAFRNTLIPFVTLSACTLPRSAQRRGDPGADLFLARHGHDCFSKPSRTATTRSSWA